MGSPPLELLLHASSHTGLIRPQNEDAYALQPQAGLAVLADGLGGGRAGEVAASMAVTLIAEALGAGAAPPGHLALSEAELLQREQAMRRAVSRANSAVHDHAMHHAECAGMGTTVVLAQWCGAHLLVGHLGDSRAYLLRRAAVVVGERRHARFELSLLTRDHSTAQRVADERLAVGSEGSGAYTAPTPPRLTRALGVEAEAVLELHRHRLQAGDLVLLCSDGLSDLVGEATIEALINRIWSSEGTQQEQALARATQALVDAALDAGGVDNVTTVLGTLAGD